MIGILEDKVTLSRLTNFLFQLHFCQEINESIGATEIKAIYCLRTTVSVFPEMESMFSSLSCRKSWEVVNKFMCEANKPCKIVEAM